MGSSSEKKNYYQNNCGGVQMQMNIFAQVCKVLADVKNGELLN